MAARSAGRFARRAFFNAAAPRPAARPAQPQPGFGFASSRSGARIARLQSSGLRREVLTMQPMHSVTANAWLVSRISEILVDAEFLQSRQSAAACPNSTSHHYGSKNELDTRKKKSLRNE
ncbi:uncharacterized protein LOC112350076 isoform X5 [Selaginella moellendorffii]|uniref:uncharacterized protein LOC112348755 isoform X5 n=1 Tax=Selaginella moellendorffii TaxID=88036 RepID=UPI000D1D01FE|nr:uncharacterized protein LOC112348755 isoform X5 [Selaginella moellendorffii]XP_024541421.1 uncharacterized protein LOC112350076 isoform X5 [Selaginella moellendorffii]|eukprot:XP_024537677.1 uncharacterized protein LOC112348755 isoform X5 [Selaginella moellendorffii]